MTGSEIFSKYKKASEQQQILLLYLIINNYDLSKVERVEEITQEMMFGVECKKIIGITSEFVDVSKIEDELAEIKTPVICSPQSYEIYSTAKTIYIYKAKQKERPLYINDMGALSPLMIITDNFVVTSNQVHPIENSNNKGFMFFVDYVLTGNCIIGAWEISYQNKVFKIFYRSQNSESKELLYHAIELDQTATFKLVLYIIRKAVNDIEEFYPDNYEEEVWRMENI